MLYNRDNLLSNVFLLPNAISDENVNLIIDVIDEESKYYGKVKAKKGDSDTDFDVRNVQSVRTPPQRVIDIIKELFDKKISKFYGYKRFYMEVPQLLFYEEGGKYLPHSDSDETIELKDGSCVWRKTIDRDLSCIIFLNEDFEGGELEFSDLGFQIVPKKGMLICFPSDKNYVHEVKEILQGKRYSIAVWINISDDLPKNFHYD